jgi:alpha-tubulin suppressor-like RCC1 family protein
MLLDGLQPMEYLVKIALLLVSLLIPVTSWNHVTTSPASSEVTTSWSAGNSGSYQVAGLPPQISGVQASGLAVGSDGKVYSWVRGKRAAPVASVVSGPRSVVAAAQGFDFGSALTSTGTLWSWGNDRDGELCNGKTETTSAPALVHNLSNIVSISGGAAHLMLLTGSGQVLECGAAAFGELGNGATSGSYDTPAPVKDLHGIVAISAGSEDSVALDSNGNVWDWGVNNWGQVGDGNRSNSAVPVEVSLPAPAVQIYSGGDSIQDGSEIALLQNGEIWAWGDDRYGELGDGGSRYSDVPVEVPGLSDIVYVATDAYTSFAVDSSGNVWEWGLVGGKAVHSPEEMAGQYSQISVMAETFVGLDA